MDNAEIIIASVLVAVVALSAVARWTALPAPAVLLAGGALLSVIPGVPTLHMDPELVLFVFLPPLLYVTALQANVSDIRRDSFWIVLNTVALVLATMGAVAVVAHALIPGLAWPLAFVLGAIVSPTDPLAAALIMRRLGVPQRMVSAIEGESLFNDATAFVAYRVAIAAAVSSDWSAAHVGREFVLGLGVGVAGGWAVARTMIWIRSRTRDLNANVTLSLLTGYVAFIVTEQLHGSGVIAAVVAGMVVSRHLMHMIDARTRLHTENVWGTVDFILNAVLFLLIGLQLPNVIDGVGHRDYAFLVITAVAVAGVVMVVRLLWFLVLPLGLYRASSKLAARAGSTAARTVLGLCGMRGAVSLALALAIPLQTEAGEAFPQRDLVVFVTFLVIAMTVVLPSVLLPWFITRAGVQDDGAAERLEIETRVAAARTANAELDRLAGEDWTRANTVDRLTRFYQYRIQRFELREDGAEHDDHPIEEQSRAYQHTLKRVIDAQRRELTAMRNRGEIPTEPLHRLVRELDWEEARLEF